MCEVSKRDKIANKMCFIVNIQREKESRMVPDHKKSVFGDML